MTTPAQDRPSSQVGQGDPNSCEACLSRRDGGLCDDHVATLADEAEYIATLLEDLHDGRLIDLPRHMERVA